MNRIKQLREEIGMTQVRLSIELEVSQETISAYEHGKHYPSVSSLIRMMKIFNTGMDYIMGYSDVRCAVNTLDEPEQILLNYYRNLTSVNKDIAIAYIHGLCDGQK